MRPEENPLDLNNLPEDYTRDGKQLSEDSSSSAVVAGSGGGGQRRKKSSNKDEPGKVYECRFCSLKFCKSQALGGHMNRHRQERETETLNKARQLVFTNDLAPGHLGYVSSGQTMGYHHQAGGNTADSPLPFRPLYATTRMFPNSIAPPPPPQSAQPYMYPSPPRLLPFSSQYSGAPPPMNDYFVGHVLPNSSYEGNYTCVGAPVGQGFGNGGGGGEEEGLVSWARR